MDKPKPREDKRHHYPRKETNQEYPIKQLFEKYDIITVDKNF
jgi:hypothetical protein